jgi:hypothetical protein
VHILRNILSVMWKTLAVGLTLLSLSSYFAYTTAGFDFEIPTAKGVDVRYARLRWDDCSTWVGIAVQPCPWPTRELNWFDLGGTLFAAPTRPSRRTFWNGLGFWRVDRPSDDPYVARRYAGATFSQWWGCPSWLILVGVWHRSIWRVLVRFGKRAQSVGVLGGAVADRT